MKIYELLNAAAATGEGDSVAIKGYRTQEGYIPIQIFGTFVGTVILEGTIAPETDVTAGTATWSEIKGARFGSAACTALVCPFTHIRANVLSYTSGSISVRVQI